MATYSHYAQRELDAASFAADDRRRAMTTNIAGDVVPFKPAQKTRRLPNVSVPDETELDDDIRDAMYDALADADGHTSAYYLRRHLAQRGILIVEASRLSRMKVAFQLIGSAAAELAKMEM